MKGACGVVCFRSASRVEGQPWALLAVRTGTQLPEFLQVIILDNRGREKARIINGQANDRENLALGKIQQVGGKVYLLVLQTEFCSEVLSMKLDCPCG